jgi:hypothetical protein
MSVKNTTTVPEDNLNSRVRIAAPYYEADFDDRIRIVINYQNTWRPIFWFQVKRDGSSYAGSRYEKITYVDKGAKQVQGGGEGNIKFDYNEGEKVTNPGILKGTKISFHASGSVNVAGANTR